MNLSLGPLPFPFFAELLGPIFHSQRRGIKPGSIVCILFMHISMHLVLVAWFCSVMVVSLLSYTIISWCTSLLLHLTRNCKGQ